MKGTQRVPTIKEVNRIIRCAESRIDKCSSRRLEQDKAW